MSQWGEKKKKSKQDLYSHWIQCGRENACFPIHFNEGSPVWLTPVHSTGVLQKNAAGCGGKAHSTFGETKSDVTLQWPIT